MSTAEMLRTTVFSDLAKLGFTPAGSMPLPDIDSPVRSPVEVAARLMSLDALFTWVAYPQDVVGDERIVAYIDRNRLREWMPEDETAIIDLPRGEAHEAHVDNIGWKLENIWALAWVLGFDPAPGLAAAQIEQEITQKIFREFLPGLGSTVSDLVAKAMPRSREEVIAMEYRFYCAHNAVRSVQLGRPTVPKGFHPVVHGGAVHERRHAYSWCVAPETSWDETDLST